MATYFHGNPEIQASDGMQTLYLMNPNYVPYSDTTILLNPAGNALNPSNASHAPPSNNHQLPLVGVSLPSPSPHLSQTNSEDVNDRSSFHGIFSGVHPDLWASIEQNSAPNHPQIVTLAAPGDGSQVELRRPVASTCRQGLSLSLSSQQDVYNRPINVEVDMQGRGQVGLTMVSVNSPSSVSVVSNGISSMPSVVLGSKYLKAAQELLDEVVNVGNMMSYSPKASKEKMKLSKETTVVTGEGSSNGSESSSAKIAAELTTAQRQELQIKKGKFVSMLDEVEQRYRQYHLQMQLAVSSFEQTAGFGSAKSYTSLALRTISKQFRCLKHAISGQIKATSKKLGEEDFLGAKFESLRLKYVDHQIREQRVLQQLGMMQHNAWRPQRGLPERAVSVLRAWLFEHFLHPYPKDSDKLILAKQTGLTRSQVSNWFINARVRLWKPMVEEMYLEEMKEQEQNGFEQNASRTKQTESFKLEQVKAFQDQAKKSTNQNAIPTKLSNSTISASPVGGTLHPQTGFNLIGSSDLEGVVQRNAKRPRSSPHDMNNSIEMELKQGNPSREIIGNKFGGERLSKDGYSLITSTTNHGGGLGAYTMGEMERFNPDQLAPRFHGNGVSLTLGLPNGENLSLSGNQQNLLSNIQLGRGLELGTSEPDNFCGINSPQPSHSNAGFENIDIQNRKRFSAQMLPDFVT
ncbi:hypothetical protein Patl1_30304 [Pistacia atlantica]|uniref:Uncharacterized protein n=1 Tax=Pistacia atlantica TaxID=434234 RepID=A0ACC1A943_9ROSI|nr:hypothetical protein Patl1_30304 [Pistacia atlantica]